MKKNRARYGCPNPECPSFVEQKKYKAGIQQCPECGQDLEHVCKNKNCYTAIEDPQELYCLSCKARREDSMADKRRLAESLGGAAVAAGIGKAVQHRHEIIAILKALRR